MRTSVLCIAGELAGEGFVAVTVGVSDRRQVAGDRRHMTLFFSPFLSVFIGFGIGATIRTRQEIQCFPYAEFLYVIDRPGVAGAVLQTASLLTY